MKLFYIADGDESEAVKSSNSEWVALQLGWDREKFTLDFVSFESDCEPFFDKGGLEAFCDHIAGRMAGADAILFDYGGMSMPGGGGDHLIDYWNRFFLKMIEDLPGKPWFCVSSLDVFEPEDKDHLKELGVRFYWDDH
jgi:hypothetical protein